MSKLSVSNDLLSQLICNVCKNYLSYFPVHKKKGVDIAVCGRCRVPEPHDFIRDDAFEIIAQFLLFPCLYKDSGCMETLSPSEMEKHEECCEFRKYACPNKNSQCQWMGPRNGMVAHFEEAHPSFLLADGQFNLSFLASVEEYWLLPYADELFVVKREVDSRKKIFFCTLTHLKQNEDVRQFNYYLKIGNINKTYFYNCPEKCANGEDVIKITLDELRDLLHDPSEFLVIVEVSENKFRTTSGPTDSAEEPVNIKDNPNINWDLLNNVQCPKCKHYMLPPIYQCSQGHSFCKDCKITLKGTCSVCNNVIGDTQNFGLEKITEHLTYPCKYMKNGCNYATKSTQITRHEICCEFGLLDCPFKSIEECNTQLVLSDLKSHVETHHPGLIRNINEIFSVSVKEAIEEAYMIEFDKRIFKLIFKYSNDKFYWGIQFLASMKDNDAYSFELVVSDDSGRNRRYALTGSVVPLMSSKDFFDNPDNYLILTHDNIGTYIKENKLRYKIKLFK